MPLLPWLAEDLTTYLAQHPHRADADAPLWPGARRGGYTHGTRGTRHPTPDSPTAGAVDYDRRWEEGTFYRRRYLPAVRAAGLPTGRGGVNFHSCGTRTRR